MLNVTRIYHSGFLVETDHYFLIFDYFKGELPDLSGKKIVVFVSHGHGDHYSQEIFRLEEQYDNVSYVLYHDICKKQKENIVYVYSHETYEFCGLTIQTLQSTDEGCAYVVKVDQQTLYHAGDLNWWHWDGEPEELNRWQKGMYQKETDVLKDIPMDCAFVVLDPRQEHNATLGFLELVKKCNIKYVFPMHFDAWVGQESLEPYMKMEEMKPYRSKIYIANKEEKVVLN